MHKQNTWELLERLADPVVKPEEQRQLEQQIKKDPNLQDILQTFRILQTWPAVEKATLAEPYPQVLINRLEHEWELEAVDRELGRVFPFVAAASLAAAVIIGIINFGAMREFANDPIDALLGLPQHSLDDIILAEL